MKCLSTPFTLSILEVYFNYTPSIPPVALPEYSRRGWGQRKDLWGRGGKVGGVDET
ncbi:MAG: hypothetical protein QW579_00980 [Desulfurococcaceae archaeon]